MGDLKTNWMKPIYPDTTDLGGQGVVSRGSDPLIDLNAGGAGALQQPWSNLPVPIPGGQETNNPMSGMPLTPNRQDPPNQPPMVPDLTRRNPGTIDEQ